MARLRGRVCLGVVIAAGAVAATPASGAGWLPPTTLSPAGGTAIQASAVPTRDGGLIALWLRAVGDGPASVEYRTVAADGALGPVRVLSGGGAVLSFRAARSPDGTVHATWTELVAGDAGSRVAFRRIDADGVAGERLTLSGPGGIHSRLGVAADGTAIVLWRAGGTTMAAARVAPDGSANTTVLGLPGAVAPGLEHPEIAVAPDGSALVAYLDPVAGDDVRPMAVRIPAGGDAGPPVELHPLLTVATRGLRVAMDPAGTAHAVWERFLGDDYVIESQAIAPAGTPGLPTQRSENGARSQFPAIAATADGLSVGWVRSADGDSRIQATVDPLADLAPLSAPGAGAQGVALDREAGGRTVVAWQRPDAPADPARIQATIVAADGSRLPVETLSEAGDQAQAPAAAILSQGEAVVVWEQDVASDPGRSVRLAHFDARAPIVGMVVPEGVTAGRAATIAAVATDRSGVVTHQWDLGDGVQASGATVTHTYTAPGERTVTLTSTDAVGNATTTTRSITVAEAPPEPPAVAPPGPGTTPADTRAPRLRAVAVRPALARRGAVAARTTRTVAVTFRLDEAARVRLAVARTAPGRRRGVRCMAPTRLLIAARARRCVRTIAVGVVVRPAAAGAGRIALTRLRLGRRTLVPGRYRLTLRATDAAGNRGAPVLRTLRVVASPRR